MTPASASDLKQATLSLQSFIRQATAKDLAFESILLEQLPLQYRRDILLPASDVIMDVKYQHNFYLQQDTDNPEASISLSKLFPYNGTELSLSYGKNSSALSGTDESSLELLISQPIAKNAFGKSTKLHEKIIGIENSISRYQIVEAYEDYLASLTAAYYNWYSAYENLRVSQSSYQSSKVLMENILDRQRQKIALPIDVNKMKLLLIGKKENIIIQEEVYKTYANLIYKAINQPDNAAYIPLKPKPATTKIAFEKDYDIFITNSRTYMILNMLAQQSNLQVDQTSDELMPSTNLLLGYQINGLDWGLTDQNDNLFAGISVRWPFGQTANKAKKQLAAIDHKRTLLSNTNKNQQLNITLRNLYLQIQREQQLIAVSDQKIRLATDILKDEAENYSYGKVSLNDYISAVNSVDENRFRHTDHTVKLNKLLIEWLRLTDQLVSEDILSRSKTK
ncbi:MAG: TolC family protein [Gammaproteobacteria bacterium]|nr:TolC family protein [Gammaproteobacteria bacterium]